MYKRKLRFSEEDQLFIAEAIDLPGCMADGETPEEAMAELDESIKSWLKVATILGRSIPCPGVEAGFGGFDTDGRCYGGGMYFMADSGIGSIPCPTCDPHQDALEPARETFDRLGFEQPSKEAQERELDDLDL